MWRLVTKLSITSHIGDRILATFPSIVSTIYVGETTSIFLCFKLKGIALLRRFLEIYESRHSLRKGLPINARHCSTIYLYKKRYSAQHWNSSVKLGCVGLHQLRHLLSCTLLPLAVGSLFHTGRSCPVSCCSKKPSVTCGIRTYGRFYSLWTEAP